MNIKFKNKIIKTILSKYSDIGLSSKYPLKDFEGQKLAIFNETGFLEISIFRSNPDNVGSATSLLGLSYRDMVTIEFKK
jgi:S-adenosylmethionine hydrolase